MAQVSAQSLCEGALRKIRAIDPDETPNATELDNCFTEFLRMAKTWASKGLLIWASEEVTHTLTQGTKEYSIGSGGTIDTSRPIKLNPGCYVASSGRDYPLTIIGQGRYKRISEKGSGQSSVPSLIWYNPTYPLGAIFVWPPGGGVLYLQTIKPLAEPAAVTNDVVFPDEYQDAIVWNLACRISPEFIGQPTPYQLAMAAYTLEGLRNENLANDMLEMEVEITELNGGYPGHDIDAG